MSITNIFKSTGDDPEKLKAALKDATEKNELLEKELEAAKKAKDSAEELLDEAHEALGDAPVKGKRPVFVVDEVPYTLVVPKSKVTIEGKSREVTAETLKDDKKLLEHLVDLGSGCLIETKDLEVKKEKED